MVKIYTKTGDKGKTSLYGGKRISKSDLRIEACGEVDELNSLIGVIILQDQRSKIRNQRYQSKIKNELLKIQNDLLEIGSLLANPVSKVEKQGNRVEEIEDLIDSLSKGLPELKNFILPGGSETGSFLHFARSVCRRVERKIVALSNKEKIDSQVLIYFNRLSDLLFVMARYVNYKESQKEVVWNKKSK